MNGSAPRRQLPYMLAATFTVILLPLLLVKVAESAIGFSSPLVSIAGVVALSFVIANVGAALWARQPGSRDVVFADLMLWGWLRRMRTERRVIEVSRLLGLGRSGNSALHTEVSQEEQADLLERLAASLEARDPHTHGHTQRVTRHAEMIARGMGLSDEEVAMTRTAAALHDVGKVEIPRDVLNKPGKLTDEEFTVIKGHPVTGAEMVAVLGDPEMTAIVRHHHERLDGGGYPDNLAGEDIPLPARIIAVADTFDAITSSRPYRGALSHRKAMDILSSEAGTQLDPRPVQAFLDYYSGSRSTSRWTFLVNGPERVWGGVRDALQTTAAAPIAKNAAAVAATAVLGSSLAAPIATAMQGSKPAQRAATETKAVETANAATLDGRSIKLAGLAMRPKDGRGNHVGGTAAGGRRTIPENRSTAKPAFAADPAAGSETPVEIGHGKTKEKEKGGASSPGKSGSAPGHNKADKPDKADKPVKATPPGQGATDPGHDPQGSPPVGDAPAAPGNGKDNGNNGQGNGKKK